MRTARFLGRAWVPVVLLCTACVGCKRGPDQAPQQPPKLPAAGQMNNQHKQSHTGKPEGAKHPAPKLSMPKVVLTEADQQTCLVKVGDQMPHAELPDSNGTTHRLQELFGPRLTVICFWAGGNTEEQQSRALDVLEFLQLEVAEPFSTHVRVIGVNVGDSAQSIAELVGKAGVRFVTLLDAQGSLFSRVATQGLPRVYLIDSQGKILWFDMELRRISRQDLLTAIRVSLGEG